MSGNVAHNISEKRRTNDVLISDNIDFEGLLLSRTVLQGLKSSGFERPSPIQLKAIPLGRCGLDLIVQAKSGTGKTCVFSVIALESLQTASYALQVLVLAPTREIAIQIWDVIRGIGRNISHLSCQTFIGGMPLQEDRQKLKKCHIAVGTPGRIKQLIEIGMMTTDSIRMFVLDEADKLLEEGFQEQINWIYSSLPENKQMLALSATYPEYLAQHLTAYMRNPTFLRLNISDPALLGINQYYRSVPFHPLPHKQFENKTKIVTEILSSVNFQQCLIFSNLQTRAQNMADTLTSLGWPTACIAGRLEQKDRNEAMSKLKTYKCRVLISTDLTSRGIDADKVDLVINLDIPKDHETYLHRIGRAGRFGTFGAAVTIVSQGQEELDLQSVEGKCNTHISLLPDPIPKDLPKSECRITIDDVVSSQQIKTSPKHQKGLLQQKKGNRRNKHRKRKDSQDLSSKQGEDQIDLADDISINEIMSEEQHENSGSNGLLIESGDKIRVAMETVDGTEFMTELTDQIGVVTEIGDRNGVSSDVIEKGDITGLTTETGDVTRLTTQTGDVTVDGTSLTCDLIKIKDKTMLTGNVTESGDHTEPHQCEVTDIQTVENVTEVMNSDMASNGDVKPIDIVNSEKGSDERETQTLNSKVCIGENSSLPSNGSDTIDSSLHPRIPSFKSSIGYKPVSNPHTYSSAKLELEHYKNNHNKMVDVKDIQFKVKVTPNSRCSKVKEDLLQKVSLVLKDPNICTLTVAERVTYPDVADDTRQQGLTLKPLSVLVTDNEKEGQIVSLGTDTSVKQAPVKETCLQSSQQSRNDNGTVQKSTLQENGSVHKLTLQDSGRVHKHLANDNGAIQKSTHQENGTSHKLTLRESGTVNKKCTRDSILTFSDRDTVENHNPSLRPVSKPRSQDEHSQIPLVQHTDKLKVKPVEKGSKADRAKSTNTSGIRSVSVKSSDIPAEDHEPSNALTAAIANVMKKILMHDQCNKEQLEEKVFKFLKRSIQTDRKFGNNNGEKNDGSDLSETDSSSDSESSGEESDDERTTQVEEDEEVDEDEEDYKEFLEDKGYRNQTEWDECIEHCDDDDDDEEYTDYGAFGGNPSVSENPKHYTQWNGWGYPYPIVPCYYPYPVYWCYPMYYPSYPTTGYQPPGYHLPLYQPSATQTEQYLQTIRNNQAQYIQQMLHKT
ncbi:uncharacterized protein [Argopecten irradians]|uniref:uncharacterized protein n=1 Tax=Argopecten irradians TaxID=31199 RepID=UPI003711869E